MKGDKRGQNNPMIIKTKVDPSSSEDISDDEKNILATKHIEREKDPLISDSDSEDDVEVMNAEQLRIAKKAKEYIDSVYKQRAEDSGRREKLNAEAEERKVIAEQKEIMLKQMKDLQLEAQKEKEKSKQLQQKQQEILVNLEYKKEALLNRHEYTHQALLDEETKSFKELQGQMLVNALLSRGATLNRETKDNMPPRAADALQKIASIAPEMAVSVKASLVKNLSDEFKVERELIATSLVPAVIKKISEDRRISADVIKNSSRKILEVVERHASSGHIQRMCAKIKGDFEHHPEHKGKHFIEELQVSIESKNMLPLNEAVSSISSEVKMILAKEEIGVNLAVELKKHILSSKDIVGNGIVNGAIAKLDTLQLDPEFLLTNKRQLVGEFIAIYQQHEGQKDPKILAENIGVSFRNRVQEIAAMHQGKTVTPPTLRNSHSKEVQR